MTSLQCIDICLRKPGLIDGFLFMFSPASPSNVLSESVASIATTTSISGSRHLQEPSHDHRRASCDELLASPPYDSDHEEEPVDSQNLLGRRSSYSSGMNQEEQPSYRERTDTRSLERRAFFIRTIALLCACSLSIGSH